MDGHDILIDDNGDIHFVYADDLRALQAVGAATTTRASHVEPHPQGGWYADMTPSGGPVLGRSLPFATRQAALDAERGWLRRHRGL